MAILQVTLFVITSFSIAAVFVASIALVVGIVAADVAAVVLWLCTL